MTALTLGSLCSGYGGLELGIAAVLDVETAWVSDIDKGACKILAHRHPDVPNIGDMTTVDWSAVAPVDVLCGGTPCQDLSHAGKRAGMTEGTRSNLWVAMREAIAVIRPRFVVWENVRGAASAEADSDLEFCPGCMGEAWDRWPVLRALGRVVGDLADLGYVGRVRGLRAADVEAPHGRFRFFLAAEDAQGCGRGPSRNRDHQAGPDRAPLVASDSTPTDTGCEPREVPPSGSVSTVPFAPGDGDSGGTLLPTPRATDGTKGGPNQRGSSGDLMLPSAVALLPTPMAQEPGGTAEKYRARWAKSDGRDSTFLPLSIAVTLLPTPKATNNENRASADFDPHGTKNFHALLTGAAQWGDYAAAITRWEHALGRPAPAPTMTSTKGNPQLSPVFVEWLMGLPAGWVTDVPGITRNEALKALGNGVVPQQAAAALREMFSWDAVA